MSDTVTSTAKQWWSFKYHQFIKELFSDFFSKSVNRYTIIYLFDEIKYVEEITRIISEINEVDTDLVRHIFVSENSDTIVQIDEFDRFGIDYKSFLLSPQDVINGFTNVLKKQDLETDKIFVPARSATVEQTIIDISDIYSKLLDNIIHVVYKNIEQNSANMSDDKVPSFLSR